MPKSKVAIPQETLEHCAAALKVLAQPAPRRELDGGTLEQLAAAAGKPQADFEQVGLVGVRADQSRREQQDLVVIKIL